MNIEGIAKSIWSQIRAFSSGLGFLSNRLWPIGYVNLRETEPEPKSSNLAPKASFAIPSTKKLFFSMALPLQLFFLTVNGSSGYEDIEDQNILKINTPSLECRKTAKIRLTNGLEAYLVSDPGADQSAAALAMYAGSWSDPVEYPGTAHFLEHMLFMGTKAYPDEFDFFRQVTDNGGSTNAYTSVDRTVYMFSVNNGAFPSILDQFAHFFIDPLFKPSGINRELLAVDQENDKNLENDSYREWMVFKATGNQDHPNAKFSTGNATTLGNIPQEVLRKWYLENYSADKAHLILYSPLPISELKKLTVACFSEVPLCKTTGSGNTQNLTSPSQEGNFIYIKPIKDLRALNLSWELPKDYVIDLENKIPQLIAYFLSNKGPHTLYRQLISEGLIENLYATTQGIGKENAFFSIDFDLTPQGMTQINTVIDRFFQTINSLKMHGFPSYIFDEMHKMIEISYQFQSRVPAFGFVSGNANHMIDEPIETYPQKTIISSNFDAEKTHQFIEMLSPKTCVFFVKGPSDLVGITPDKKEKWSEAEYSLQKIEPSQLDSWETIALHPNISIPLKNPFIPTNLELINIKNSLEYPHLISNNEYEKIYFTPDSYYQVPEISWNFALKSPLINGTSKNAVLLELYAKILKESLASPISDADAAGLNASFSLQDLKFVLSINGYSDKAPLLLDTILEHIKNFDGTKDQFELYKTSLASQYANMDKAMPAQQSFEIAKNLLFPICLRNNELLSSLREITYDDFTSFAKQLFNVAYLEAMLTGNMEEDKVVEISKTFKEKLAYSPYLQGEHSRKTILVLPDHQGPYKVHETTEVQGNAALLILQEGPFSFEKNASSQVLGTALEEDFFTTLRTKQQTAYIAKCFTSEFEQQLLKFFLVQSTTHQPDELIARFELFIENYVKDFEESFPEGRFENIKKNLVITLGTRSANLKAHGLQLTELAFTYDGQFDRIQKQIEAIKNLDYAQLKKDSITFLSRQNLKRIAIMLEGASPKNKRFCYEKITVENMKSLGTYISWK